MPTFTSVPDVDALTNLFEDSDDEPVVLFLHDDFCPISGTAYDEVLRYDGEVALIDVAVQHEVKRAVAERSGVKHESPQAMVLRNGKPVWHASHGKIRYDALKAAIEQASATT